MENSIPSSSEPDLIGIPDSAASRSLERRRAAYAEEVRRLVAASFVLIRDQETLDPRVSEIVRAAGLSNQAFYRHFRSKDELLLAVLRDGVQQLRDYLAHRMEAASGPLEAVREFVSGICEQGLHRGAARATRPFALSRARLMDQFPQEIADAEASLTGLLGGALAAARDAGELPGAEPERDARTVYDLAIGWLQARLAGPGPIRGDDAAHLVAFALRGLRRP